MLVGLEAKDFYCDVFGAVASRASVAQVSEINFGVH